MEHPPPQITISPVSSRDTSVDYPDDPSIGLHDIPSEDSPIKTRRKGVDYKDLDDLLRDVGIKHMDEIYTESFWSPKILGAVLTRERILEELLGLGNRLEERAPDQLADEILFAFRIVFAILCLLGKGECIVDFIDDGVGDASLPYLVLCVTEREHRHVLARSSSPNIPLRCLQSWRPQDRKSFTQMQHRVTPAFLDLATDQTSGQKVVQHKQFESTVVLPFMECKQKEHGGYGIVSRVKIHPDCHGFCDILKPVSFPSHIMAFYCSEHQLSHRSEPMSTLH